MAHGLLKNIQSGKFIATLYVLNSVLPQLAYLSLAYQKGKVNFGHIKPAPSMYQRRENRTDATDTEHRSDT